MDPGTGTVWYMDVMRCTLLHCIHSPSGRHCCRQVRNSKGTQWHRRITIFTRFHLLNVPLRHRYWAVTNVDYIHSRTSRRVLTMIFLVWLAAVVVSLAPQFGWKDPEYLERIEAQKCMVSQDVAYQVSFVENFISITLEIICFQLSCRTVSQWWRDISYYHTLSNYRYLPHAVHFMFLYLWS